MATPQQAPAVIPPVPAKVLAIKKVLDARQAQIAEACGQYLDPQTLMRVAMTQIYRTPKLQDCDPWSIVGALMDAAQIGLVAGGPQQEGYLIPRKNKTSGTMECTFMPSYRGLMKLAIDSGAAASVDAHVVYENDKFDYGYGIVPFVEHRPALTNRGKPIAAYCAGTLTNGQPFLDVLSFEEIEKARKSSQAANDGPWASWWDEMARKTAIRRMCKRLKGTPRLGKALELEASQFGDAVSPPPQRPMPRRLSESAPAAAAQQADPPPRRTYDDATEEAIARRLDDLESIAEALGKPADALGQVEALARQDDDPLAVLSATQTAWGNELDAKAEEKRSA